MVDCTLCEQAPGTIDVSFTKNATTGFAYTQNARTSVSCMYQATGQMNFFCQHLKHVAESVEACGIFSLTEDKISSYPCDSATKEMLNNVAVYKVSDRTFVSFCPPSATNTSSWLLPRED